MIYATSDIHGYPLDSFLDLLKKVDFGPSDHLYVIGDVIDRNGDGGVAMLRWMMKQPNVTLIRGNHEAMMLDCEFLFDLDLERFSGRDLSPEQQYALLLWNQNGALVTITNLTQLKMTDPEEFSGLIKYVRSTPLYRSLFIDSESCSKACLIFLLPLPYSARSSSRIGVNLSMTVWDALAPS